MEQLIMIVNWSQFVFRIMRKMIKGKEIFIKQWPQYKMDTINRTQDLRFMIQDIKRVSDKKAWQEQDKEYLKLTSKQKKSNIIEELKEEQRKFWK